MQENWTHLEEIMNQFNDAVSKFTWQEVAEGWGDSMD